MNYCLSTYFHVHCVPSSSLCSSSRYFITIKNACFFTNWSFVLPRRMFSPVVILPSLKLTEQRRLTMITHLSIAGDMGINFSFVAVTKSFVLLILTISPVALSSSTTLSVRSTLTFLLTYQWTFLRMQF